MVFVPLENSDTALGFSPTSSHLQMTNFQGGTRVNAWISGGYLAKKARVCVGSRFDGVTHV